MTDISDVFSDEPQQQEETETSETVETSEGGEKVETKAEPEKAEAKAEPTSDTDQEAADGESKDDSELGTKERAYLAEAKDERRKRQKLQGEIEELRAKLDKFENPESASRPDVFEDQEAFAQSLVKDVDQKISRAKLDVARDMMKSFHDDYEEIESMVIEEMGKNPVLKSELQQADNIAKAVYDYGKRMQKWNEIKEFDPEAYKAKLKAELQAELAANKPEAEDEPELSPSLTNARGGQQLADKLSENPADLFN